ncbi:hypothetical protein EVAR_53090_1 [Eumeta japonica]|uniref:Uncharacterized protein n=1 Tax=Eumeta variegata TaxID=151549 RepID=A0A4C1ZGF6_EUMVA|nr:hypothetical protein EVAR_53090_1 [Eumeta japonica]
MVPTGSKTTLLTMKPLQSCNHRNIKPIASIQASCVAAAAAGRGGDKATAIFSNLEASRVAADNTNRFMHIAPRQHRAHPLLVRLSRTPRWPCAPGSANIGTSCFCHEL